MALIVAKPGTRVTVAFPNPYARAHAGRWSATPNDVVARLNQVCVVALNSPKTKTRFAALMAEPVPTAPQSSALS